MRQTFRSWSLGACIFSLVWGAPVLAQEVELASGSNYPTAQLIGWSPDEQRYAFRTYSLKEDDGLETETEEWQKAHEEVEAYNASRQGPEGFCKGYLDHKGKPFKGSLTLVVFEGGKKLLTLPIQDEPRCTDTQVAAERLGEAKKKLLELGIDTGRVGQEFALVSGKKVHVKPEKQPPYAVEYAYRVRDIEKVKDSEDPDPFAIHLRGTLDLLVHRGGKKQKVYSQKVKRDYSRSMGGMVEESLSRLYVSPSGERGVVLGAGRSGDGRSGFAASLTVAPVLGWPEAVIAKDK